MSENYTITPGNYPLPDKRLMAWVEANGLDPNLIVADHPITVSEGVLTAQSFKYRSLEDMGRVKVMDGEEPLKFLVSVPLVSHVYEHGVTLDSIEKGN